MKLLRMRLVVAVHGLKLESRNSGEMTHALPLASQGKAQASPLASVYAFQLRLDKTPGKAQVQP
ncbi:MAG: hypothetical protein U9R43_12800 [Thermodesulfobacteriota bacterium]|nr:hypothetical protein [Thermodesulfobacteriota bacterium]